MHGVSVLRIISGIIFALLCIMNAMVILELFGLISRIIWVTAFVELFVYLWINLLK